MPSSTTRSTLHGVALHGERLLERLRPDRAETYERLTVVPYLSHGNRDRAVLRGRVLENPPLGPATKVEPLHRRARRMARRFLTREIPQVDLAVTLGGATARTTTDDEGYWVVEVEGHGLPDDRLFHEAQVTPVEHRDVPVHAPPLRVAVPSRRSRRVVVSDIDDTILVSNVANTRQFYRTTFTSSAWTRQSFPGTAELYTGLHRGPELDEENLVAYLSSSAWNLHDFLAGFIARAGLPAGPLFLRDLGIDEGHLFKQSHESHKQERLAELFAVHDLPFVLVGDTGQHDAEIYRAAVADHPGRVEAVLLRHVADDARLDEVRQLYADAGVPMAVSTETADLAARCEELGLVGPGWTERVAADSG